jgi:hypothetical protein
MKSPALITLAALLAAPLTHATTLLEESFNYTPNASLTAANASWVAYGSGADPAVVAQNLSFDGLKGSTGNALSLSGAGSSNFRTFTAQTTGTVYFSFLLNVTDITSFTTTSSTPLLSLLGNDNALTPRGAGVFLRPETGGYVMGLNKVNSSPTSGGAIASSVLSVGQTYLIVASYEIISGSNNDVVSIWINPTSSTFANDANKPTSTFAITTGTDFNPGASGISALSIMHGSGLAGMPSLLIDEVRVGTTWADVTPSGIPEPSSIALLAGGFILCATTMMRRRPHR